MYLTRKSRLLVIFCFATQVPQMRRLIRFLMALVAYLKIFQVRINPDGRKPMFRRKKQSNGEQMWHITDAGEMKMQELFAELSDVIDCGLDGTDTSELFAEAVDCGGLSVATRRFFFA